MTARPVLVKPPRLQAVEAIGGLLRMAKAFEHQRDDRAGRAGGVMDRNASSRGRGPRRGARFLVGALVGGNLETQEGTGQAHDV